MPKINPHNPLNGLDLCRVKHEVVKYSYDVEYDTSVDQAMPQSRAAIDAPYGYMRCTQLTIHLKPKHREPEQLIDLGFKIPVGAGCPMCDLIAIAGMEAAQNCDAATTRCMQLERDLQLALDLCKQAQATAQTNADDCDRALNERDRALAERDAARNLVTLPTQCTTPTLSIIGPDTGTVV